MQQVNGINVDKLPKTGYYVSKDENKEKFYETESHIYKQGPLTGVQVGAHRFVNNFLTYFPKGFKGSKNLDFYEFLSMGQVPYVLGSIGLIAMYGGANGAFKLSDKVHADKLAKRVGAGVALYAVMKWLSPKISRRLVNASTGVDLDLKAIVKKEELPEQGQDKGVMRVEYHGVYDSAEFPRTDLLAKDGELNHGNVYYHDDKITKKLGYKDHLNAANQIADTKRREVKVRETGLENFSKHIAAATGVAIGFQKSFEKINLKHPSSLLKSLQEGVQQLWKGNNRNMFTKNAGKAMIIASIASALATWLIPTKKFKEKPDTMKSKVDTNKEFEVC